MKQSEKEELISMLLMRALLFNHDPHKPGEVIRKLPEKKREKIKELTSDDWANMRYI